MKWLPDANRGQFFVAEDIDGFHPKAIFWRKQDGNCFALVGSSNLSRAAFASNHEINAFKKIEEAVFQNTKQWIRNLELRSVVVSEAWLSRYVEATRPNGPAGGASRENDAVGFILELPLPKNSQKLRHILTRRRHQMSIFADKKQILETLFRDSAATPAIRWAPSKNEDFYDRLNANWVFSDDGCRFQGAGWERQGKGSDFRKLSMSIVRVLDADDFVRDDVVTVEIDRMAAEGVTTRKALFSEMLCQFFPDQYHLLDRPVRDWLDSTEFTPPRKATEGVKYVDFSRKLRIALQRAPKHPAKNLAELDAVIWLATQENY